MTHDEMTRARAAKQKTMRTPVPMQSKYGFSVSTQTDQEDEKAYYLKTAGRGNAKKRRGLPVTLPTINLPLIEEDD